MTEPESARHNEFAERLRHASVEDAVCEHVTDKE
jgi:hypothetical protein